MPADMRGPNIDLYALLAEMRKNIPKARKGRYRPRQWPPVSGVNLARQIVEDPRHSDAFTLLALGVTLGKALERDEVKPARAANMIRNASSY